MSPTTVILYQISQLVDNACLNVLFDGHVRNSLFSGYGAARIAIVDLDSAQYASNVIAQSKAGIMLRGRLSATEMQELLNGKDKPKKKNYKRKRESPDVVEISPMSESDVVEMTPKCIFNMSSDEKMKLMFADTAEEVDRVILNTTNVLGPFSFVTANDVPFGISECPFSVAELMALGGSLYSTVPTTGSTNKLSYNQKVTRDNTRHNQQKTMFDNRLMSCDGSYTERENNNNNNNVVGNDKHSLSNSTMHRMQAKTVPAYSPPSNDGNSKRTVLNHVSFDSSDDDSEPLTKDLTKKETISSSENTVMGDAVGTSTTSKLNNRQRKEQRRSDSAKTGNKSSKVTFSDAD